MEVNSEFKGFTILELIVAMAIVAVLVGLSLLGIQTVQRSSRDTQRRSYVDATNLEITDYYGNNNVYPAVALNAGRNVITIGPAATGKTVVLQGAGVALSAASTQSTIAGSVYCYTGSGLTTYSIGVNLESGSWFNEGNAAACATANL